MNQPPVAQYIAAMRAALAAAQVAEVIAHVGRKLRPPHRIMLVGGFLRDAVLRACLGIEKSARDLDFIVFGLANDEELQNYYAGDGAHSRTTFGGLRLKLADISVDIWRAEQQIQNAGHTPYPCASQELLKYITLTTDSGSYEPARDQFYESGFYRAMMRQEIDLGERSLWLPRWKPYHLAHLAFVWHTTHFSLSPRAVRRVRETASPDMLGQALNYLTRRKHLPDATRLLQDLVQKARQETLHHEAPR